jgi:hypothetical protein
MLHRNKITICSEIHTKHMNALQNYKFQTPSYKK